MYVYIHICTCMYMYMYLHVHWNAVTVGYGHLLGRLVVDRKEVCGLPYYYTTVLNY